MVSAVKAVVDIDDSQKNAFMFRLIIGSEVVASHTDHPLTSAFLANTKPGSSAIWL